MSKNEHIAGLKIVTGTVPASLIKIILKYRKDSIAKIKQDIEKGNYVLSCSFVGEPEKFNSLIKCYNEVICNGFAAELYDHDRKSSLEYFNNWSNTMKEIRQEAEGEDLDWDSDDDDSLPN